MQYQPTILSEPTVGDDEIDIPSSEKAYLVGWNIA